MYLHKMIIINFEVEKNTIKLGPERHKKIEYASATSVHKKIHLNSLTENTKGNENYKKTAVNSVRKKFLSLGVPPTEIELTAFIQ